MKNKVLQEEYLLSEKPNEWGQPKLSPLFWLLCIALILLWFLPLGYRDLIRSDEGRYAEIAREMWLSGDWITPRLNGVKYFEKPPLQYWATSLFYVVFSPSEWTARLWPALTGFAGVLLTLFVGRRIVPVPVAGLAALIQVSMLWYVGIAHFNVLDMGLCFFLQIILLSYAKCVCISRDQIKSNEKPRITAEHKQAAWWIGVGIAGAFLSKGLVAVVLPGMVFVLDCIWHRDRRPWLWSIQWRIWSVALALSAPWCFLISQRNPEFAHFFFIHEHFERFSASSHHRDGPIYYFIPILLVGLLPWTFFWLKSVKEWIGIVRSNPLTNSEAHLEMSDQGIHRFQRLLIVWSISIFVFFSISHSKLPSYILPIFPALAYLLGLSLYRHRAAYWRAVHYWMLGLWALLLASLPFISSYLTDDWTRTLYNRYCPYVLVGLLCMGVGSVLFLWMTRQSDVGRSALQTKLKPLWMIWMVPVVCWSIGIQVLFQGHQVFSPRQSIRPLLNEIVQQHGLFKKEWAFFSVDTYEQTLDFYINRTTTLVHFLDEMEFGCHQEPRRCINTMSEWRKRWLATSINAYAIMPTSLYQELHQELPMQLLGQNQRYAIVMRFPKKEE